MDPLIGSALIKGGADLLGNVFNIGQQNKTNELNYKMFQEANQFAHNEAELAFNRQAQFTREMFDAENFYNSPIEQVKRLQEAGLSPFQFFQNGNGTWAASAQDVSSPMATSSVGNAMVAPSINTGEIFSLNGIANIMNAITDKKYKERLADKLVAEVDNLLADKDLKESQKNLNDTIRVINDLKAPYEIQNLCAEYYKSVAQKDLFKSEKLFNDMQVELGKLSKRKQELLMPFVTQTAQLELNRLRSEINRNTAAAEESRASAGYLSEQTATQRHLTAIADYEREYKTLDYGMKAKYIQDNWRKIIEQLDQSIDTSTMSDWEKYQEKKRLGKLYERLNNAKENSEFHRFGDDLFKYISSEIGINLSGNLSN